HRPPAAGARDIDYMYKHFRAFEVAQELMAETLAAVSAFDQSRHVGNHETSIVAEADDAEIRSQRGERIVCDLRPGCRDARDQRRLAGIRKSNQPDVGQQLEIEPRVLHLTRFPRLHLAGLPVRGRGEPRVSESAASAPRHEHAL